MDITLMISVSTFRQMTQIPNEITDSEIVQSIVEAQDIYLENVLGTPLFDRLVTDITNSTVAGDYKVLLDKYILKYLTSQCLYDIYGSKVALLSAAGVVRRTSENYEQATLEEVNMVRAKYKGSAEKYKQRLICYLADNEDLFDEYSLTNEPGDATVATNSFGGMFIP